MPRKRNAAPSEVFISHSSKNAAFIRRLQKVLAVHGVKSFISKLNIQGAQQWHDEIGAALRRCDWFVLVLSPQSVRSTWVKHELIYALQENRYKGRIVPVLYKKAIVIRCPGPFRRSNGLISARISTKHVDSYYVYGSSSRTGIRRGLEKLTSVALGRPCAARF